MKPKHKGYWIGRFGSCEQFDRQLLDTRLVETVVFLVDAALGATAAGNTAFLQYILEAADSLECNSAVLNNAEGRSLAECAARNGRLDTLLYLKRLNYSAFDCCAAMREAFAHRQPAVLAGFSSVCNHYETRDALMEEAMLNATGAVDTDAVGNDVLLYSLFSSQIASSATHEAIARNEWQRISSAAREFWDLLFSRRRQSAEPPPAPVARETTVQLRPQKRRGPQGKAKGRKKKQ